VMPAESVPPQPDTETLIEDLRDDLATLYGNGDIRFGHESAASLRHASDLIDALARRLDEAQRDLAHETERADRLGLERERVEAALAKIKTNAEAWHGSESLNTGAQRALNVIAATADNALRGLSETNGDTDD
jgi:hypothetical protein